MRIQTTGTLTLNATPVTILGRETQFNTQTLAGLALQTAQSTVTLTAGANGSVLLNTGAITRAVGTTLRLDAGANTGLSTTNANTNGILGGWFTVGRTAVTLVMTGSLRAPLLSVTTSCTR